MSGMIRKGAIARHAELQEEGGRARRRLRRGAWLAVIAWSCFVIGIAGVMVDGAIELSTAAAWIFPTMAVLGAALFGISAWLKTPETPRFLHDVSDPWE